MGFFQSLSLRAPPSLILSLPFLCECVLTFSHSSAPSMTEVVVALRGERCVESDIK
jgi:hypothetical protein